MQKSKLLRRQAAEPAPVETAEVVQTVDVSAEVMEYARRHKEDVFVSDKEVPEHFRDLRPADGEIDPGYFLVPGVMTGSQMQKDNVVLSNYRVFVKRYSDVDGVFTLTGDKGSFGIAIRISAITGFILDDLIALDGSPAIEEQDTAQVEHEQIDEAWHEWTHYDFIRGLETRFPEQADKLDDDQAREIFDRVRRRIGAEWTQDSNAVFIDVEPVAAAVTAADFKP